MLGHKNRGEESRTFFTLQIPCTPLTLLYNLLHSVRITETWFPRPHPSLQLSSCVALSKSHNVSEPLFLVLTDPL